MASEAAFAAAGTGAIIGASWGWIAGIGAFAIPGVEWFLAVGPVVCAMSGIAIAAAIGGVFGSLLGRGIPVIEITSHVQRIMTDKILFIASTENYGETDYGETNKLKGIFGHSGLTPYGPPLPATTI